MKNIKGNFKVGMNTTIVEIKGFRIHTRADRIHQDMAVINEVIDGDGYGLLKMSEIIKEPEVILDVGGHIGTFGLLAKRYWPQILLIAIEPNFVSYLLYCRNMQENDCKNYYILNRALAYGLKTVCLLEGSLTSGGGHTIRSKEDTEMCIAKGARITYSDIPTITIEEIINTFSIKKIGLAKWDCEGCEVGAFKSMSDESASIFEYMVGEYHIYDEMGRHLKGREKEYSDFLNMVKEKFPHLSFNLPEKGGSLGQFKAYPKL